MPPPILPLNIADIDISPFNDDKLLFTGVIEKEIHVDLIDPYKDEGLNLTKNAEVNSKPILRNTYTQTEDEQVELKSDQSAALKETKLSVDVAAPPFISSRLFESVPEEHNVSTWNATVASSENSVVLTPALAAHANTEVFIFMTNIVNSFRLTYFMQPLRDEDPEVIEYDNSEAMPAEIVQFGDEMVTPPSSPVGETLLGALIATNT